MICEANTIISKVNTIIFKANTIIFKRNTIIFLDSDWQKKVSHFEVASGPIPAPNYVTKPDSTNKLKVINKNNNYSNKNFFRK